MSVERCRVRFLSALLVPVVLAVGACGGSGDDAATPTTAAGGNGASAPSSTAAGSEGGIDDVTGDFCERALALEGNDEAYTAGAVDIYRDLLEVAPDEVRPDLETMIEYFEAIDPAGSDPDAAQRVAEISQDYADASVRTVRYVNENC